MTANVGDEIIHLRATVFQKTFAPLENLADILVITLASNASVAALLVERGDRVLHRTGNGVDVRFESEEFAVAPNFIEDKIFDGAESAQLVETRIVFALRLRKERRLQMRVDERNIIEVALGSKRLKLIDDVVNLGVVAELFLDLLEIDFAFGVVAGGQSVFDIDDAEHGLAVLFELGEAMSLRLLHAVVADQKDRQIGFASGLARFVLVGFTLERANARQIVNFEPVPFVRSNVAGRPLSAVADRFALAVGENFHECRLARHCPPVENDGEVVLPTVELVDIFRRLRDCLLLDVLQIDQLIGEVRIVFEPTIVLLLTVGFAKIIFLLLERRAHLLKTFVGELASVPGKCPALFQCLLNAAHDIISVPKNLIGMIIKFYGSIVVKRQATNKKASARSEGSKIFSANNFRVEEKFDDDVADQSADERHEDGEHRQQRRHLDQTEPHSDHFNPDRRAERAQEHRRDQIYFRTVQLRHRDAAHRQRRRVAYRLDAVLVKDRVAENYSEQRSNQPAEQYDPSDAD